MWVRFALYSAGVILNNTRTSAAELGSISVEFTSTNQVQCISVTARDDHVTEGNQTSQLEIIVQRGNTVPVAIYPSSIPLTVIDNDGKVCMHCYNNNNHHYSVYIHMQDIIYCRCNNLLPSDNHNGF